jgi:predicted DNA binding CopG/RHH family protein
LVVYRRFAVIKNVIIMKVEALKKRLDRNRPMTTITIRIPEDVIEDLKQVAPLLGFSGYQPLVRAYIGQGLRADLERLQGDTVKHWVCGIDTILNAIPSRCHIKLCKVLAIS